MKEYIVSLNRGVDYDTFWNEIENPTLGLTFIPDRRVDIVNNRDGSLRSCHYALTDEEASLLQNDPRVYSVEIPPQQRDDLIIGIKSVQRGNFTKPTDSTGTNINWGLKRVNSPTNLYGTGTTTTDNYDYILDGTGVDVVIQDSGIEVYHPEFKDANGTTRVQTINWYTESGISGTQNANHYRDYDGHGTHVAGIAAGKTYGWAKNARIYSVKVSGLEGSGDSGTGISVTDCFDVIKLWHRNKPIDPTTGKKRPTIVNMSWGYRTTYSSAGIQSLTYRGTTYSDASTTGNANYRWTNYGILPLTSDGGTTYTTNTRVGSVDTDIQELIDEGVHVIIAGGNNYHKIDDATGADYNNYITVSGVSKYYHRGSSPFDDEAMKVGCIDSTAYSASLDQKAEFSETGPGIDIFAPGSGIISCTSNTNIHSAVAYNKDGGFKQVSLAGTSQAAPQVCGLGALYLQLNPGARPAQLKSWFLNTAYSGDIYSSESSTDYTNLRSLLRSEKKILYNPFNRAQDGSISGGLTLTNGVITLT